MITSTTLPPWITPTLPETSSSTTPSGLIVPGSAQPAPGTSTTTTPSGLVVVRGELSPVSRGSQLVIATGPLEGNAAVEAAREAHAQVAATHGTAAADVLLGSQVELVQGVRNDELRAQAIAALLAGDLATATALISQTR